MDALRPLTRHWMGWVMIAAVIATAFGCSVGNAHETWLFPDGSVHKREVWAGTLATDRAVADLRLDLPPGGGIELGAASSTSDQDAAELVRATGEAVGKTIGELIDRGMLP